jgi:hypothetical protein
MEGFERRDWKVCGRGWERGEAKEGWPVDVKG